jgi:hypothetical protein
MCWRLLSEANAMGSRWLAGSGVLLGSPARVSSTEEAHCRLDVVQEPKAIAELGCAIRPIRGPSPLASLDSPRSVAMLCHVSAREPYYPA